MPADFSKLFPTNTNADLAERYGVGQRTVVRWARSAGLVKDPEWKSRQISARRRRQTEADGHQRCIGCGLLKPVDDFYDASQPGIKMARCKPCYRDQTNTWRSANPDAARLISRRSALKRTYGITVEAWDEMLVRQGGRCAICGRADDGSTAARRLNVDHDHGSGIVRGLLCGSCNNGIGRFQHDPKLLAQAITYLEQTQPNGGPADADDAERRVL